LKWELAHWPLHDPISTHCHCIVRTLGVSMLRASSPQKLGVPPLGHGSQPQNDGGSGPERRFQAQSAQRSMLWPHACSHGMTMGCNTEVQGCSRKHAGENGAQLFSAQSARRSMVWLHCALARQESAEGHALHLLGLGVRGYNP
jgi:hypothetical protein